ncbi:WbqC family protein [Filimonas lacunae]|nr:WbqC family protein [Filimonas lacunae]BAV06238.1 hypothetical protein FLA_2254 [Filimonas lacunae]
MLSTHTYVNFEACENFQKNSFRNRCVVAGSNGVINLSVPLVNGRDQKVLYKQLKIDHTQNWQVQHWRTITSCYQKAPFFEYFAPGVESLLTKQHEYLFEANLEIITWLKKVCKLKVTIGETSDYVPEYTGDGITDARNAIRPNNYQQSPELVSPYYQMFEDRIGYQPNLSILDLLFCAGPTALF